MGYRACQRRAAGARVRWLPARTRIRAGRTRGQSLLPLPSLSIDRGACVASRQTHQQGWAQRFFKPTTDLGEQWQTVQSALSGAERIFQVLAIPEDRTPPPHGVWNEYGPVVQIDDLTFGYLDGRAVVNDVRLAISPGEQVALVGRTGGG
jgi:ATPase subunit of ABC transporter with duplicated ATPase domains